MQARAYLHSASHLEECDVVANTKKNAAKAQVDELQCAWLLPFRRHITTTTTNSTNRKLDFQRSHGDTRGYAGPIHGLRQINTSTYELVSESSEPSLGKSTRYDINWALYHHH